MSASSFVSFLVDKDIFGQPISVFYQGSDVYKTRLGAFFTFVTYSLIAFNFITLTEAYFGISK